MRLRRANAPPGSRRLGGALLAWAMCARLAMQGDYRRVRRALNRRALDRDAGRGAMSIPDLGQTKGLMMTSRSDESTGLLARIEQLAARQSLHQEAALRMQVNPLWSLGDAAAVEPAILVDSARRVGHVADSARRVGHIADSARRVGQIADSARRVGHIADSARRVGHIADSARRVGAAA